MPVIYVPQQSRGKNISAALKYGDSIVECLSQDYQVYANTADTVDKIRDALKDFSAEDYLLLIGDPILIGLTTSLALDRSDSIKVLKWDAQTRTYVPVTLDVY